jgi:hypothetical protein
MSEPGLLSSTEMFADFLSKKKQSRKFSHAAVRTGYHNAVGHREGGSNVDTVGTYYRMNLVQHALHCHE